MHNAEEPPQLRNSGIDILGGLEWGTHCCNFYDTKQDLVDILIPYFKAGLENNEFCLWITSDAMTAAEAIHALQEVVPDLEDYIRKGSIEIIPHVKWYLKGTVFDTEKLIKSWLEKLDKALASGYDGMRANGNESWVEHAQWKDFIDYERQLNYAIANHRMIVLCTYPLANCDAACLLDIVHTHERAVSKRNDKWEVVEEPFLIQTKAQIHAENSLLEQLVAKRTFQLALVNEDLQKEIEQHKETEETLRKTEANYREIFDKASDGIFIIEVDTGKVIDANKKSSKITGFAKEELVNRHFSFIYADYTDKEANEKVQLAANREGQIFDCQFKYKDGNIHWVEVNLTVANIAGTERVLSFFHQIDNRKSAEEALQKSEANLRTIFDNTDTGYILLDTDLHIISFNHVAFDFIYKDLHYETKVGDHILNYFNTESQASTHDAAKEALNGSYVSYEVAYPQQEGSVRWYCRQMFPISNDKNMILGIVAAISDITERKKIEKERELIIKELLKTNADLKQFSFITSHNLRAPLSNIRGILNLINYSSLDETNAELLEMLKSSEKQLSKTIDDLTRILVIKNSIDIEITTVNIADVFEKLRRTFSAALDQAGAKVFTDFKGHLIDFNQTYLESILFNLFSNAVKYYSPDRSLIINAASKMDEEGNTTFTFSDNGIGIDLTRHKERLFGLYQRFHANTEGQGLGLYIIKSQIEAMEGRIDIISEVDKGTSFIITFKKRFRPAGGLL